MVRKMTHSQEARVSSSQDSLRLSEENISTFSALVNNKLNSCAGIGAEVLNDEKSEKGATTSNLEKKKMQAAFPWLRSFTELQRKSLGCMSIKILENVLSVYLQHVSIDVKNCYMKPNRAAKLKKCICEALLFFHLQYQDIREPMEHSFYLTKMTDLMSMYMDMEIKAARRMKETTTKIVGRITTFLQILLDHSEHHILDAILRAKLINSANRELCVPILRKILSSLPVLKLHEMMYVRRVLVFKLWKKIVKSRDEKKRIATSAVQKLPVPNNFQQNAKLFIDVLPRIPKSKKNISLFFMQAKFNLKIACKAFLKMCKESQPLGDKALLYGERHEEIQTTAGDKVDDVAGGWKSNMFSSIWSSLSVHGDSSLTECSQMKAVTGDKEKAETFSSKKLKSPNKREKKLKNKSKKNASTGLDNKNKKKKTLKKTDDNIPVLDNATANNTSSFEIFEKESEKSKNKTYSAVEILDELSASNSDVQEKIVSSEQNEEHSVAVKTEDNVQDLSIVPVVEEPSKVYEEQWLNQVNKINSVGYINVIEERDTKENSEIVRPSSVSTPEVTETGIVHEIAKTSEQINKINSVCSEPVRLEESGVAEFTDHSNVSLDHSVDNNRHENLEIPKDDLSQVNLVSGGTKENTSVDVSGEGKVYSEQVSVTVKALDMRLFSADTPEAAHTSEQVHQINSVCPEVGRLKESGVVGFGDLNVSFDHSGDQNRHESPRISENNLNLVCAVTKDDISVNVAEKEVFSEQQSVDMKPVDMKTSDTPQETEITCISEQVHHINSVYSEAGRLKTSRIVGVTNDCTVDVDHSNDQVSHRNSEMADDRVNQVNQVSAGTKDNVSHTDTREERISSEEQSFILKRPSVISPSEESPHLIDTDTVLVVTETLEQVNQINSVCSEPGRIETSRIIGVTDSSVASVHPEGQNRLENSEIPVDGSSQVNQVTAGERDVSNNIASAVCESVIVRTSSNMQMNCLINSSHRSRTISSVENEVTACSENQSMSSTDMTAPKIIYPYLVSSQVSGGLDVQNIITQRQDVSDVCDSSTNLEDPIQDVYYVSGEVPIPEEGCVGVDNDFLNRMYGDADPYGDVLSDLSLHQARQCSREEVLLRNERDLIPSDSIPSNIFATENSDLFIEALDTVLPAPNMDHDNREVVVSDDDNIESPFFGGDEGTELESPAIEVLNENEKRSLASMINNLRSAENKKMFAQFGTERQDWYRHSGLQYLYSDTMFGTNPSAHTHLMSAHGHAYADGRREEDGDDSEKGISADEDVESCYNSSSASSSPPERLGGMKIGSSNFLSSNEKEVSDSSPSSNVSDSLPLANNVCLRSRDVHGKMKRGALSFSDTNTRGRPQSGMKIPAPGLELGSQYAPTAGTTVTTALAASTISTTTITTASTSTTTTRTTVTSSITSSASANITATPISTRTSSVNVPATFKRLNVSLKNCIDDKNFSDHNKFNRTSRCTSASKTAPHIRTNRFPDVVRDAHNATRKSDKRAASPTVPPKTSSRGNTRRRGRGRGAANKNQNYVKKPASNRRITRRGNSANVVKEVSSESSSEDELVIPPKKQRSAPMLERRGAKLENRRPHTRGVTRVVGYEPIIHQQITTQKRRR